MSLYPDTISVVDWYTIEDGFKSDNDFKLIRLEEFTEDDEELETEVRSWVYLNPR